MRRTVDDELLPFADKAEQIGTSLAANTYPVLSPIDRDEDVELIPLDVAGGRVTLALDPDGEQDQAPTGGTTLSDLVIGPVGEFELRVLDAGDLPIDAGQWDVLYTGDTPTAIRFLEAPYPSGAKVSAWQKATVPTVDWALLHDDAYDGDNQAFNRVEIDLNGTAALGVVAGAEKGRIVLAEAGSAVTADYWYRTTVTRYFCGEQENWLPGQQPGEDGYVGHIGTGPDIFRGLTDYGGDHSTDDQGAVIDPGELPAWVDPDEYEVSHRDGLVVFVEPVDVESLNEEGYENVVRANYAHLAGIRNVTGQVLTEVPGSDGKRWKAIADPIYPDAIGKRWVGRRDLFRPRNVYVDGQLTPTPDNNGGVARPLSVKTGP